MLSQAVCPSIFCHLTRETNGRVFTLETVYVEVRSWLKCLKAIRGEKIETHG